MGKFPSMSISNEFELFDKHIEPILSYWCEEWGMKEAVRLENIQYNSALKNTFVYGELGRYPLRITRVIDFWLKKLGI